MNQAQRKYLIDKIQKNTDEAIKQLKETLPKEPSLYNYCIQALAAGTLKMTTTENLMAILKKRLLKNGTLDDDRYSFHRTTISFEFNEIFEIPEDYIQAHSEWQKEYDSIKETINTLKTQAEGLCTRIQLASDKTLDAMIAEVDNMGDITFMDCTLKALMTKGEKNLLK